MFEYIAEGKNAYGVKSPTYNSKGTMQNQLLKYFNAKYVQKVVPELVNGISPEEYLKVLELFESESHIARDLVEIAGADQNALIRCY